MERDLPLFTRTTNAVFIADQEKLRTRVSKGGFVCKL
jgi:hypothetical protein